MRNKRAKQLRRYAGYLALAVLKEPRKQRRVYKNAKKAWHALGPKARHKAAKEIKRLVS